MRPPLPDIDAPPFPGRLPWINVAMLRMDQLRGSPVLVEFWDFCRVNSLRTLPYVGAWHDRYRDDGLRVVGVHAAGFPPGRDPEQVRLACERLGVRHPVVVDAEGDIWELYGNEGWPARYVWDQHGKLAWFHYGEGEYAATEQVIQELLGVERDLVEPFRPEDAPDVLLPAPTDDQVGPYSGPYAAGGVWAVLDGDGTVRANGIPVRVDHPGAYPLLDHPHHTEGVLDLEIGEGVECYMTSFTPGVPAP